MAVILQTGPEPRRRNSHPTDGLHAGGSGSPRAHRIRTWEMAISMIAKLTRYPWGNICSEQCSRSWPFELRNYPSDQTITNWFEPFRANRYWRQPTPGTIFIGTTGEDSEACSQRSASIRGSRSFDPEDSYLTAQADLIPRFSALKPISQDSTVTDSVVVPWRLDISLRGPTA